MGSWFLLTTWLSLVTAAAPAPEQAALTYPPPPNVSPKHKLAALLVENSGASSDERIAVARLAGLGRWELPGLSTALAHCAQTNTPEAAACIMALVARNDLEELPAIRSALRAAQHPAVVAAGCLALSAFNDGHSRSLVMLTLLRQQGGTLGGMACAGALDRLNRWTNARYQLFAWRYVSQPAVRQYLATQILRHTTPANRTMVYADQLELATRILALPSPSRTDREALVQAACTLAQAAKSTASQAESHLDALLKGLPPGAPGRCALCSQALELCGAHFPSCQAAPTGCEPAPLQHKAPDLRQTLRTLRPEGVWGHSNDQWDSLVLSSPVSKALGITPEQILPLLKEARLPKRRLAEIWSPESLLDTASSRHPKPAPPGKTYKKFAKETFPEEFLKFEPPFQQPSWLANDVFLTIDDGPSLINLPGILASLERHQTKAIFFFVGVNIISHGASHPEFLRTLICQLLDHGNLIGYHSMEHALTWPNHIINWDYDQVVDDANLFRLVLFLASGRNVSIVYGRSPGGTGTHLGTLKKAFQMAGLKAPVGWNREFRSNVRMDQVQHTAQSLVTTPTRAIVLMHEYFSTPHVIDTFLTAYQRHKASPPPAAATVAKPK